MVGTSSESETIVILKKTEIRIEKVKKTHNIRYRPQIFYAKKERQLKLIKYKRGIFNGFSQRFNIIVLIYPLINLGS